MTGRDLEIRDAAERLDWVIAYIARSKDGWEYMAADIADLLWVLMPDLVERHMPEATHLARADYAPDAVVLKRAVAQAWPDDEPPF